jgi:hypothetical protein
MEWLLDEAPVTPLRSAPYRPAPSCRVIDGARADRPLVSGAVPPPPPPPPGANRPARPSRRPRGEPLLLPGEKKPRRRGLDPKTRREVDRWGLRLGWIAAIVVILGGLVYGAYVVLGASGNFPPRLFEREQPASPAPSASPTEGTPVSEGESGGKKADKKEAGGT